MDDDDDGPDVRASYTAALEALGLSYEIWNTDASDDEPDAEALAPYATVIWFTGDSLGGSTGPGAAGEAALTAWLDGGGCLLMSSQDYLAARGLTPFIQGYLGVGSFVNDVSQLTVAGQAPVFGGLGPYGLIFAYANRTDLLAPGPSAELAFDGTAGGAGVDRDAGWYRATFWGFGLETVAGPGNRQAVLARFLDWCTALAQVDGDADGVSNAQDCAPGDPTQWSAPSPARELRLSKEPLDNLAWLGPGQPGALAVTYDLLRSEVTTSFASAVCLEAGEADTVATDLLEPGPGERLAYLVRVTNGCGSNLGYRSDGSPHTGATCP